MTTKVKLDLVSLEVQSFSTTDDGSGHRGTVHANSEVSYNTIDTNCGDHTCHGDCHGTYTCDPGATYYPCCVMMD